MQQETSKWTDCAEKTFLRDRKRGINSSCEQVNKVRTFGSVRDDHKKLSPFLLCVGGTHDRTASVGEKKGRVSRRHYLRDVLRGRDLAST